MFVLNFLGMKFNIPICFENTQFVHCRLFISMFIYKIKEQMCSGKKNLLHDSTM